MGGVLYGVVLQWKMDLRSKTMLITCYAVPLVFFALMGGVFITVMPDARQSLIQSMTVFGVTMGAFIGVPPSLVSIYGGSIKKVYRANGLPLYLGLLLTNISAFVHLFTMSILVFVAAPIVFGARLPANAGAYFIGLAVLIIVSLSIASILGLAVRDQAKTSMIAILMFLPSVMLSGMMFPAELLGQTLQTIGKLFPATWGYLLMTGETLSAVNLAALLVIGSMGAAVCVLLLKRLKQE